jgi:hypothetical protein
MKEKSIKRKENNMKLFNGILQYCPEYFYCFFVILLFAPFLLIDLNEFENKKLC